MATMLSNLPLMLADHFGGQVPNKFNNDVSEFLELHDVTDSVKQHSVYIEALMLLQDGEDVE